MPTPGITFPSNPTNGMMVETQPGVVFMYDAAVNSWIELTQTNLDSSLATDSVSGLMPSTDLQKLNRLVVPPPVSTITADGSGIIYGAGNIALLSLDPQITITGNSRLYSGDQFAEVASRLLQNTYGIDFQLNLPALVSNLTQLGQLTLQGKAGTTGQQGQQGLPGPDQQLTGPAGDTGLPGLAPTCLLNVSKESFAFQAQSGLSTVIVGIDQVPDPLNPTKFSLVASRQQIGFPDATAGMLTVQTNSSSWVIALANAGTTAQPVNYLDVDGLVDVIYQKYLSEIQRLKTGYENVVSFWLQSMSNLFDSQKLALCCALEFCQSQTTNNATREHLQTVAATAMGSANLAISPVTSPTASTTGVVADCSGTAVPTLPVSPSSPPGSLPFSPSPGSPASGSSPPASSQPTTVPTQPTVGAAACSVNYVAQPAGMPTGIFSSCMGLIRADATSSPMLSPGGTFNFLYKSFFSLPAGDEGLQKQYTSFMDYDADRQQRQIPYVYLTDKFGTVFLMRVGNSYEYTGSQTVHILCKGYELESTANPTIYVPNVDLGYTWHTPESTAAATLVPVTILYSLQYNSTPHNPALATTVGNTTTVGAGADAYMELVVSYFVANLGTSETGKLTGYKTSDQVLDATLTGIPGQTTPLWYGMMSGYPIPDPAAPAQCGLTYPGFLASNTLVSHRLLSTHENLNNQLTNGAVQLNFDRVSSIPFIYGSNGTNITVISDWDVQQGPAFSTNSSLACLFNKTPFLPTPPAAIAADPCQQAFWLTFGYAPAVPFPLQQNNLWSQQTIDSAFELIMVGPVINTFSADGSVNTSYANNASYLALNAVGAQFAANGVLGVGANSVATAIVLNTTISGGLRLTLGAGTPNQLVSAEVDGSVVCQAVSPFQATRLNPAPQQINVVASPALVLTLQFNRPVNLAQATLSLTCGGASSSTPSLSVRAGDSSNPTFISTITYTNGVANGFTATLALPNVSTTVNGAQTAVPGNSIWFSNCPYYTITLSNIVDEFGLQPPTAWSWNFSTTAVVPPTTKNPPSISYQGQLASSIYDPATNQNLTYFGIQPSSAQQIVFGFQPPPNLANSPFPTGPFGMIVYLVASASTIESMQSQAGLSPSVTTEQLAQLFSIPLPPPTGVSPAGTTTTPAISLPPAILPTLTLPPPAFAVPVQTPLYNDTTIKLTNPNGIAIALTPDDTNFVWRCVDSLPTPEQIFQSGYPAWVGPNVPLWYELVPSRDGKSLALYIFYPVLSADNMTPAGLNANYQNAAGLVNTQNFIPGIDNTYTKLSYVPGYDSAGNPIPTLQYYNVVNGAQTGSAQMTTAVKLKKLTSQPVSVTSSVATIKASFSFFQPTTTYNNLWGFPGYNNTSGSYNGANTTVAFTATVTGQAANSVANVTNNNAPAVIGKGTTSAQLLVVTDNIGGTVVLALQPDNSFVGCAQIVPSGGIKPTWSLIYRFVLSASRPTLTLSIPLGQILGTAYACADVEALLLSLQTALAASPPAVSAKLAIDPASQLISFTYTTLAPQYFNSASQGAGGAIINNTSDPISVVFYYDLGSSLYNLQQLYNRWIGPVLPTSAVAGLQQFDLVNRLEWLEQQYGQPSTSVQVPSAVLAAIATKVPAGQTGLFRRLYNDVAGAIILNTKNQGQTNTNLQLFAAELGLGAGALVALAAVSDPQLTSNPSASKLAAASSTTTVTGKLYSAYQKLFGPKPAGPPAAIYVVDKYGIGNMAIATSQSLGTPVWHCERTVVVPVGSNNLVSCSTSRQPIPLRLDLSANTADNNAIGLLLTVRYPFCNSAQFGVVPTNMGKTGLVIGKAGYSQLDGGIENLKTHTAFQPYTYAPSLSTVFSVYVPGIYDTTDQILLTDDPAQAKQFLQQLLSGAANPTSISCLDALFGNNEQLFLNAPVGNAPSVQENVPDTVPLSRFTDSGGLSYYIGGQYVRAMGLISCSNDVMIELDIPMLYALGCTSTFLGSQQYRLLVIYPTCGGSDLPTNIAASGDVLTTDTMLDAAAGLNFLYADSDATFGAAGDLRLEFRLARATQVGFDLFALPNDQALDLATQLGQVIVANTKGEGILAQPVVLSQMSQLGMLFNSEPGGVASAPPALPYPNIEGLALPPFSNQSAVYTGQIAALEVTDRYGSVTLDLWDATQINIPFLGNSSSYFAYSRSGTICWKWVGLRQVPVVRNQFGQTEVTNQHVPVIYMLTQDYYYTSSNQQAGNFNIPDPASEVSVLTLSIGYPAALDSSELFQVALTKNGAAVPTQFVATTPVFGAAAPTSDRYISARQSYFEAVVADSEFQVYDGSWGNDLSMLELADLPFPFHWSSSIIAYDAAGDLLQKNADNSITLISPTQFYTGGCTFWFASNLWPINSAGTLVGDGSKMSDVISNYYGAAAPVAVTVKPILWPARQLAASNSGADCWFNRQFSLVVSAVVTAGTDNANGAQYYAQLNLQTAGIYVGVLTPIVNLDQLSPSSFTPTSPGNPGSIPVPLLLSVGFDGTNFKLSVYRNINSYAVPTLPGAAQESHLEGSATVAYSNSCLQALQLDFDVSALEVFNAANISSIQLIEVPLVPAGVTTANMAVQLADRAGFFSDYFQSKLAHPPTFAISSNPITNLVDCEFCIWLDPTAPLHPQYLELNSPLGSLRLNTGTCPYVVSVNPNGSLVVAGGASPGWSGVVYVVGSGSDLAQHTGALPVAAVSSLAVPVRVDVVCLPTVPGAALVQAALVLSYPISPLSGLMTNRDYNGTPITTDSLANRLGALDPSLLAVHAALGTKTNWHTSTAAQTDYNDPLVFPSVFGSAIGPLSVALYGESPSTASFDWVWTITRPNSIYLTVNNNLGSTEYADINCQQLGRIPITALDSTTGLIVVGGPYSSPALCQAVAVDTEPTARYGTLNWQGQWSCQSLQPGQPASAISGAADVVIDLTQGGAFQGWQQTYHTFPNSLACVAYGVCVNPLGSYNRWQFFATGVQYCLPASYPAANAPCPPHYGTSGQSLSGLPLPPRSTQDTLVGTHDGLAGCVAAVDSSLQSQAAAQVVTGGEWLVALDAGLHSGTSSSGIKLQLDSGEYTAEILATDARWVDKYLAPVRLQYQGQAGRKLLVFPDLGEFADPVAAKLAYEGQTVQFLHNGGKLCLYLPDRKVPAIGKILLRLRSASASTQPLNCSLPVSVLTRLEYDWAIGAGTGFGLVIDNQDYLLWEFETAACGRALLLWPTFDGLSPVAVPAAGTVTLKRDLHAFTAVNKLLSRGDYHRRQGDPTTTLDIVVPEL